MSSRISFDEALLTLHGTGPVLATAREVSQILRDADIEGAVIGGVAVGLHGHARTTLVVDVFVASEVDRFAELLKQHGFAFDARHKQFVKAEVPVQLVTLNQLGTAPQRYRDIDDIRTVSLADLINIKLRSGLGNLLRAQDLADVIGLIRHHRLKSDYAGRIDKSLRSEFRKLVKAIQSQRRQG